MLKNQSLRESLLARDLLQELGVEPGITSVIGSGGKTTLIACLAKQLRAAHPEARIVLSTTTHILPFEGVRTVISNSEAEIARILAEDGIVCVGEWAEGPGSASFDKCPADAMQADALHAGSYEFDALVGYMDESDARGLRRDEFCPDTPVKDGETASAGAQKERRKLKAPSISFTQLLPFADYILVEADGSKHKPLKAHADYEPVIPDGNRRTILVVGSHGLGLPVGEVAHRPELFAERTGCDLSAVATRELVECVIERECELGLIAPDVVLWS